MSQADRTDDDRLARLVQRIDPSAHLLGAWPLSGGVSATVTAIEIERSDGRSEKLVVRRHGAVDLAQNPNVATDEFRLLQILRAEGLPVPEPVYVDAAGDVFDSPCVVVAFIEGSTEFAFRKGQQVAPELGAWLARIHTIDPARWRLSFLPSQTERGASRLANPPARLDTELDEGRIRGMLQSVWPLPQRNRASLLHGDFWPGNTLWRDGQLTGIVDWEDAGTGDPLIDLANSRLELSMLHGPEAMDRFTSRYLALNPLDNTDLPYWDLYATLRPIAGMPGWGLDADTLHAMRAGLTAFIAQAFVALG